jgi:hypothetical protein
VQKFQHTKEKKKKVLKRGETFGRRNCKRNANTKHFLEALDLIPSDTHTHKS